GTLNLPFSLPANLCDDIPDIQHQIDCFESVDVGSGLQVSRETARQLLLDCRNGGGGNSDQDDLVGASGEVRVNLTWNNTADLDLAVLDPCGNTISFGTQSATCQGFTGTLDVDANAGVVTTSPAENIVWPNGAAPGNYTVTVSYFASRDVGTTSFSGQSFFAGTSNSFSGSLAVGESQQVDSFTHQ
ncbi:MAG: hypothetical protein GY807_06665, partial [Gammaproteobacteria bacterium]|nr:hypothetical protein [Gammaproteobacteria bacterium]